MKQLTTYINEKANFIVKKHVTNNIDANDEDKIKTRLCDFINWVMDVEDYTKGFPAHEIKMRLEYVGFTVNGQTNLTDGVIRMLTDYPGLDIEIEETKLEDCEYKMESDVKILGTRVFTLSVTLDRSYKQYIEKNK